METRYFLKTAISVESRVFYLKILADSFRYLAQIESGQTLIRLMAETNQRYSTAISEAQGLETTSPLKLALVLNYACFKYEVEQNFEDAIEMTQTMFNEALMLF